MAQIEVKNLNKTYQMHGSEFQAVINANLSIKRGEFISIVGHSGSGKTTLLSIMGGILKPTSGQVLFEGQDIYAQDDNGLSAYRADKVGYIFQFASLLPVLTARENLLLPTLFRRKSKPSDDDMLQAEGCLMMLGLEDKLDSLPSQLSGGQQRRVAIGRAMINNPEIVLADEPTGDLDEETEAEVMRFLRGKCRERNITFVLVTHNMELAKEADRVLVMSKGVLTSS